MNSTTVPNSSNLISSNSFKEADALRERLQQIAFRQRRSDAEHCIENEKQRRLAEWSAAVKQLIEAEHRLQKLQKLAEQQLRSDHLCSLLAAANLEIPRSTVGLREALKKLDGLSGTNISRESIQKIHNDSERMAELAITIEQLLKGAQHLDQAPTVREFRQFVDRIVQNMDGAASNVQELSEKTISGSSDLLIAKTDREMDEIGNESQDTQTEEQAASNDENAENIPPV